MELVVLQILRFAQARHPVRAQGPVHLEPLPHDRPPLRGQVLRLDRREAGAPEQPAIALEGLQCRGRHPLPELPALPIAQSRVGDPVGEGEPPVPDQDAVALLEHRGLVGDVHERLLAETGVEGAAREGERRRVPANDRHARLAHEAVEPGGAGRAARVELERGDGRAPAARQEPGGSAEARADVEDPAGEADAGPARQSVDGGQAPVVVLVELEEGLGGQRPAEAPGGEGREHPRVADRVLVVERLHAPGGALKHGLTYGKSKPISSHLRRGKPMGSGSRGGLEDIVEHSSFEEVIFLLWHGGLPSKKELVAHTKALSATANRRLPPGLVSLLKALPKKTTPMEVLRTGVSALSAYDPDAADNSKDATARKALRLT